MLRKHIISDLKIHQQILQKIGVTVFLTKHYQFGHDLFDSHNVNTKEYFQMTLTAT